VHKDIGPSRIVASRPRAGNARGGSIFRWDLSGTRKRSNQFAHLHFLAVGPPRTGTSWLHENLSCAVNLPYKMKETRYFDEHFRLGFSWYASQFRSVPGRIYAEIGPTYFYSDQARKRIFAQAPDARIVCSFREPAERLYSLYKLKRARAVHNYTFEAALDQDPEMAASAAYGTHYAEWLRLYGRDRVMPVFYDDLSSDPHAFLKAICDFVGVHTPASEQVTLRHVAAADKLDMPRHFRSAYLATNVIRWLLKHNARCAVEVASKARLRKLFFGPPRPFPKLDQEVVRRVRQRTFPEVEKLEQLTGRDLTAWKDGSGS
jgi:Sulfotransferase domain